MIHKFVSSLGREHDYRHRVCLLGGQAYAQQNNLAQNAAHGLE